MLRIKLQEVTDGWDTSKHPDLLAEITQVYPNSIRILNSPVLPLYRYTCFMHAFDFVEKDEYVENFGIGSVFAGAKFGQWLIDNDKLEEASAAIRSEESLIFYFCDGGLKHAGVVKANGRIISKWGTGHLYEHAVFEVPESYGINTRIFRRPHYENAFRDFLEFADLNLKFLN